MNQDLTRYLNDHLAGSAAALPLIRKLAESHEAPEARDFFLHFKDAVKADQDLLEDLLVKIGQDPSTLKKVAGGMAAHLAGLKLMWEEIEPGKLGLFEGLEMLALGVEGKRLLWAALREITNRIPEWEGIDFEEMDSRAIRQRESIEFWRIRAASDVFAEVDRRVGMEVR